MRWKQRETLLVLREVERGLEDTVLPNQSLKLTEPAVDDFAARRWTGLGTSDWHVRATSYLAAAVRRRSLAPVR